MALVAALKTVAPAKPVAKPVAVAAKPLAVAKPVATAAKPKPKPVAAAKPAPVKPSSLLSKPWMLPALALGGLWLWKGRK